MKSSFQLVDEPDEEPTHSEPELKPEQEGAVEGKGKAIVMPNKAAQLLLAMHTPKGEAPGPILTPKADCQLLLRHQLDLYKPVDETSAIIIHDSSSSYTYAGTGAIDPDKTSVEGVTEMLIRPWCKHSLSFDSTRAEDPLSSTGTLSSMKNLEDAYAIGDQFINDKSSDYELGKLNVEAEVVSMVIVLIYQASSSVPPLSTLVIDLSPPKPALSTTQTPIFTATIMTITTPLPPPP
ncbi:hypothetical protein Tco_0591222 [Tanacetum coccineum]